MAQPQLAHIKDFKPQIVIIFFFNTGGIFHENTAKLFYGKLA